MKLITASKIYERTLQRSSSSRAACARDDQQFSKRRSSIDWYAISFTVFLTPSVKFQEANILQKLVDCIEALVHGFEH